VTPTQRQGFSTTEKPSHVYGPNKISHLFAFENFMPVSIYCGFLKQCVWQADTVGLPANHSSILKVITIIILIPETH